jgi:hypothetical protein
MPRRNAMKEQANVAELQYSPEYGRLEVLLPHGAKLADFSRLSKKLFSDDILGKLPRGCPACTSGDALFIRERLEHVVRVDLDKMEAIEGR